MYPFYLGIDLHNKNTNAVLIDKSGTVLDERRFSNDETKTYLEKVVPRETYAVLEATRNWPFMYDLLTEHVARVELAHPKELKAISAAAVKTDQIDAKVLAQLARLNYLPTAYAAPPETRDLRMYIRHREILVQERTQCKNRIHAVLARYNLRAQATDLFGKAGQEWLQDVLEGELLRPAARRVIADNLAIIHQLNEKIEALEKDLQLTSEQKEAVKLLKTIPGGAGYSHHDRGGDWRYPAFWFPQGLVQLDRLDTSDPQQCWDYSSCTNLQRRVSLLARSHDPSGDGSQQKEQTLVSGA